MSPSPADNPIVELELRQLDLSHADLRIVDSQSQSRLVLSIEAQGQLLPVVVVRQDNRNILIDGFARARALRRLGKDTVWALLLAHSEAEALLWCYRQQQGRRPTAIEEAWLVHELHLSQRQPLPQIAVGLCRSTSWVSRRLGLVRSLPEAIQQLVRQGAISPHAAMRTLLPLARANADVAHDIAQIAKAEQLSSRQISRLCAGWRAGDPRESHARIGRVQVRSHVSARRGYTICPVRFGPAQRGARQGWTARAHSSRAPRKSVAESHNGHRRGDSFSAGAPAHAIGR